MKFKAETRNGVVIVRISGQMMGGPENAKIHDEVKKALGDDIKHVLVDLHGVSHMSSSGLGCLIACRASVTAAEGSMKLLKPASRIQEVLRITDLMRYFECFNDEEEAIRSFAG